MHEGALGTPPDRGRYASAYRDDGQDGIGKNSEESACLENEGCDLTGGFTLTITMRLMMESVQYYNIPMSIAYWIK